ncbi:MAG TPA: MFS transporter [Pyrinomonadaceae bacterium]|nr:MFS transporter [Pyrinomonadaceae bacterium]
MLQYYVGTLTMTNHLRLLKYYTLFAFFVIGVATVLLGQVLPILIARLGLNDAQAGTLLLAQFSGALTGTLVVGWLIPRIGFAVVAVMGLVLMIVGVPGLNAGEFWLCWAAIYVYGVGIGISIPSINLLTIDNTPSDGQTSAVNLLNFAWGVGAICSGPYVAAVSSGAHLGTVTVILVLALLAVAICFFSSLSNLRGGGATRNETVEPETSVWRRRYAWLFLPFAFFVVGVEGGVSGWLTTYSEQLRAAGGPDFNATVVYFMFFVLGRGIAAIVAQYVSENKLITICSLTLASGVLIIVASEPLVLVGAAVAGLGSSALFPTNISRFTKIFGPGATRHAAPIFVSGTFGAASISSLVGYVSHQFGSLRLGIVVILISALAVVGLQVLLLIAFRRSAQRS